MLNRVLFVIILVTLYFAQSGYSQSKEQVYAGIIFHIMKYVEWPGQAELSTMSVGVLNDNRLTVALNKVAQGKSIVFKNIEIIKFTELTSLKNTNVLFVPQKMTTGLSKIMDNVNTEKILVISEKKKKDQNGASINFVEQGGRMRFEVYEGVFAATSLKMSEQLRKYAIIKG